MAGCFPVMLMYYHKGVTMKLTYEHALEIATKYHEGQVRKFSGVPYITHPIAVADRFILTEHRIAAVLHDTIEDTDLTLNKLSELGASPETITVVDFLTHDKDQSYFEYIICAKQNPTARVIKIADIKHNMSDLKKGCMRDKYELALFILET